MPDGLLATTFRFRVTLTPSAVGGAPPSGGPLGDGGFQECAGLDVEMDVAEYVEGGRNNGVIQRAGRAKVSRITLKRGMLHPADGTVRSDLWQWWRDTPGFSQRFTAKLVDGGRRMVGQGELNRGDRWEPDLQLTYTRIA